MDDDKNCETSYCPSGQQDILPVLKNLHFKGRVDGVEGASRDVCSRSQTHVRNV